jgi:hypothetical protein
MIAMSESRDAKDRDLISMEGHPTGLKPNDIRGSA